MATLWLSDSCHLTARSDNDFVSRSFILKSAQQEEALNCIWYTLKRWRLISQRIVFFPTMACSSINQR
ncbi:unnamed protein product [Spirodela intermedia]|uniref:Uncharacterized protein n=1 Tax=Spirodela intermedia TaxID=51605 RepID=A0A7I8LLZ8_SPIIN|nr:unnamed protein product [Spirodela intermedia]